MTVSTTAIPPDRTATAPSIGRFAPSPTGELHFGSLVAAVGSLLQARSSGGLWRVRIEDIDPPRTVPGSAERILEELARFGMTPDGPVLHQGERSEAYQDALNTLAGSGRIFACACSRRELPDGPYPGTCRNGVPAGREGRSLRFRVPDEAIRFTDAVQGTVVERLTETCGDFVLRRADGLFAYQLAVVVDDAAQGITEVVRGTDLLDSTARQIALQEALGVPTPRYVHLPIVVDEHGQKLGKRLGSDPLSLRPPLETLGSALTFLGHEPPAHGSLPERWAWALAHWDLRRVPRSVAVRTGPDGQAVYLPE